MLRSHVTLVLSTILHAFTHAYGTMLVPLYLLMSADLKFDGVTKPAMLVTIYGVLYALCSYAAGVLADRHDRKLLLGIGLIGNAIAITLMGFTRQYELLIALAVLAGVCGSLFHPAANALLPAHYPKHPGMAIGLLGIGSGIGFWAGPQWAGWRGQTATWQVGNIADWQRPCVEMGVAGLVFGILFLFVAREVRGSSTTSDVRGEPLGRALRWRCVGIASILSLREFAGIAVISLASVYLQKALGQTPKETGFVLGTMMLVAVVVNPILTFVTRGARRIPSMVVIMVLGGIVVAFIPFTPARWILGMLTTFYAFQLGSSAVNDAAMLERVSAQFRGRFVGLFLSIALTVGSLGPWVMGAWTDSFGERAAIPSTYVGPFLVAGIAMALSALSVPLIARLGEPNGPRIDPLTETTPATVGVVG
jgi:FSR family fosmidomycin resistance protein-like MFS transporter